MATGREIHGRLTAPDDADHRIQHVVHGHAPASDITERGIYLLADISECRARARISSRHTAVTDRRKQHRDHGKQNRSHGMAVRSIAENSEQGHRCGRLYDNYAIQDQVPQSQATLETNVT